MVTAEHSAMEPLSNCRRPIRFMQVHDFYGDYLNQFYAQHREVAGLSFERQTARLIADAMAAIHILPPYLRNLGWKTRLVIYNCHYTQFTWAREHHLAAPAPGTDVESHILRAQIADFRPDILYILGDYHRFGARFIASLPYKPHCVVGWRAADVPVGTDWTGYDIILSSLPGILALAPGLGAKESEWFAPGMPDWIARSVEQIEQDTDVVFVGGISPTQHVRRHQLLNILANAATKHGFSLNLHLSCDPRLITPAMRPYLRPPVFGLAMHKALRRGKIVFDSPGTVGLRRLDGSYAVDLARGHIATMRLHEGTGGGSLVLLHAQSAHTQLFESGREIVTFSEGREMIDNILYYLSNEQERAAIAEAGKRRSLGEWNMKNRSAAFVDIIKKRLI